MAFSREEEAPENDLYETYKNDRTVNPFRNSEVPETATIDVSEFCMPTMGYVTSPYGYRPRFRRMHKGIDLKVQIGDTIRAALLRLCTSYKLRTSWLWQLCDSES